MRALPGLAVLVADDEPLLRRLMKRVLEATGHRVLAASDGSEALALLTAEPDAIEVAVLDARMPPFAPLETLRRVLELRPDLGIVLTSGITPEPAVRDLVAKQGGLYLPKPFAPDALRWAVDAVRPREAR